MVESAQTFIFKDNKSMDAWYYGFLRRHPTKVTRLASSMQSLRATMTQPKLAHKVKEVYDKYGFHTRPFHIFYCDERGFQCGTE